MEQPELVMQFFHGSDCTGGTSESGRSSEAGGGSRVRI